MRKGPQQSHKDTIDSPSSPFDSLGRTTITTMKKLVEGLAKLDIETSHNESPLMRLPRELRDHIYADVATDIDFLLCSNSGFLAAKDLGYNVDGFRAIDYSLMPRVSRQWDREYRELLLHNKSYHCKVDLSVHAGQHTPRMRSVPRFNSMAARKVVLDLYCCPDQWFCREHDIEDQQIGH